MKKLLIILLACGFISSTNVFAEDQTVIIKVKINKLSQEQADQIPSKVNEIFKGSCHIDVDSKPVPQKGKTWKYNNMPYLFPEPVLIPNHHGDHGDRDTSKVSRGNFPSPAPGPKPGPDKDGKCHHKDKHDGKYHGDKHGNKGNHDCSHGNKGHRGDKHGDKGKSDCSHGDKGHHGKGDHGKGNGGHGEHGKGDSHSNGGHHGGNCGGHGNGGHGGHGKGK